MKKIASAAMSTCGKFALQALTPVANELRMIGSQFKIGWIACLPMTRETARMLTGVFLCLGLVQTLRNPDGVQAVSITLCIVAMIWFVVGIIRIFRAAPKD